jgi:hypothetical protein
MKQLIAAMIGTLMCATLAHAVVSYSYTLDNKTSRTTSSTGTGQKISYNVKACAARLHAVNNSGTTPTLDAKVQFSPDNSTWFDELSFTQVATGTSDQLVHIDTTVTWQYIYVRSVTTLAGTTPNYDFTVYFDCE